jgi:hypothetical protein
MARLGRYFQKALFLAVLQLTGYFLLLILRRLKLGNNQLFEQISIVAIIQLISVALFIYFNRNFGPGKSTPEVTMYLAVLGTLLFFVTAQFSLLNIDRSRSFYVLSWVQLEEVQLEGRVYLLDSVKSQEKVNYDAIAERIEEQKSRGFLTTKNSEIRLTKMGGVLMWFANNAGSLFDLRNWKTNKL